jgi:hypothetical protein
MFFGWFGFYYQKINSVNNTNPQVSANIVAIVIAKETRE